MRSENKNRTMRLGRFLAKGKVVPVAVIGIDLVLFLSMTYLINVCGNIGNIIKDIENAYDYMGISCLIPHIAGHIEIYMLIFLVLALLDAYFAYQIRVSLGEADVNLGTKGTGRWTTQREVREQFKAVPLKTEFYRGKGGTIVQRQGNKLYIDDSKSNTLIIGTTRSGKGEMYVVPSIDVYSRAEKIENRPSMIISDPKLELYKMCKAKLEERGYEVRLLNLDDPYHSMGYNPLQLVINYYKQGNVPKAQMMAKTYSFSIFAADNSSQEAIWKNTATDLYTSLIIAITTDCLDADRELNETRRRNWIEKRKAYRGLSYEDKRAAKEKYYDVKERSEDIYSEGNIFYIPDEEMFYEVNPNEKKVNSFSCLNFFRELCDRKALDAAENDEERAKLADTALDEYFNSRPPLDFAKSLYQEIKTAGDRTKGSVYINMQSALSIFALDSIARLTAENDVDIESLGYGDKPVAIFIGLPSEDKSNHFLVTTFISQVYQRLFQLTKSKEGKNQGVLDRNVKFILDEFGNFPEIENFKGFVTVCLGIGISFDIYVQALDQIESIYKDDAKTIRENFANQVYIKSVGDATAKEFVQMLGNTTVIEVQRSGSRLGLNKTFTETPAEKPLISYEDIISLREGECVLYRGLKRTDRLGIAVRSYPIISEYADTAKAISKAKEYIKMRKDRKAGKFMTYKDDESKQCSLSEEWKVRKSQLLQREGTALLYRYQYLSDEFPNPNEVTLTEINTETRENVNYLEMVVEPMEALSLTLERYKAGRKYKYLKEIKTYQMIAAELTSYDASWRKNLEISEEDTISAVSAKICRLTNMDSERKERLISLIGGEIVL